MIWHLIWIIGIIAFLLVFIILYREDSEIISNIILSFFIDIPIIFAIFFITFIATLVLDGTSNKTFIKTDEIKIYNNKDNKYLTIADKNYKLYVKDDKITYTLINQTNSSIIEDNNCYVQKFTQYYTNDTIKWLLGDSKTGESKYEIHIPKDSITTEYKVDLK